jgi:hypothetical protein
MGIGHVLVVAGAACYKTITCRGCRSGYLAIEGAELFVPLISAFRLQGKGIDSRFLVYLVFGMH